MTKGDRIDVSSMPVSEDRRRLLGRLAGRWSFILALTLTAASTGLALFHARIIATRLIAQSESQAARVASDARQRLDVQAERALARLRERLVSTSALPFGRPDGLPAWIENAYVWDGRQARTVLTEGAAGMSPPTSLPDPPTGSVLDERLTAGRAVVTWINDGGRMEPKVFAVTPAMLGDSQPVTLAISVTLDRVLVDVLQPELPTEGMFEIVDADTPPNPWTQPFSGPLRRWAIAPSVRFIREQRTTLIGQSLVQVGLSVLALATLGAAMLMQTRAARREMKLADMKAAFVADVSHELKTPLALIRMFAETLQEGRVASEEKRREYYGVMVREAQRLTNLINNILDFSRIEAGKKQYHFGPTDVGALVRRTFDSFQPQLEQAGFEHRLSIAENLPAIEADAESVERALINLINNAVKYSEDDRFVGVDVARDTRRGRRGVLISVQDRGIGVRPEDRGLLTEGFFRSSDARVRNVGGTGLGLALVKQIADAHHGSLDVESRLVKGSAFRLFLPETRGAAP